MLRSSEFWMSLILLIGEAGVGSGWWTQSDFNEFVAPCLAYIVGRVTSKIAKAVPALKKQEGK